MVSKFPFHKKIYQKLLRQLNVATTSLVALFLIVGGAIMGGVLASATSNFTMVINPASLAVGIVDSAYQPMPNPIVALGDVSYGDNCQSGDGVLGTVSQQIYIQNPHAADNGWTVTLAAVTPTDTWASEGQKMDFNDSNDLGCADGNDNDTYAGQMIINPENSTLLTGQCTACVDASIVRGPLAGFEENVFDSITLVQGSPSSDDFGDWILRDIEVVQTIPAFQPATSSPYTLDLSLSITAQ